MGKQRLQAIVAMLCSILLTVFALTGCSGIAAGRSPEEMLSLSIAGLTATDNFIYKGQTTVSTADGWSYTPSSFEGKVVGHKQLKAQTNDGSPLDWSPVRQLEELNRSAKQIVFADGNGNTDADAGADGFQVKLHIQIDEAAAKKLWKRRLTDEFDKLKDEAPIDQTAYRNEWLEELNRSRKQLDNMLQTLQVNAEYDLVVDRNLLIPLSMNEHTVFTYKKEEKQKKESRNTVVQFSSFDGSAANVQQ